MCIFGPMELVSLAQLDRSHRRHDDVMSGLLEAARRLAAGRPDPGDIAAVHDAVAYFDRAVTRHFLDEEGSVFPRLSTRRPELAEALAALSAEHPAQIALHGQIALAAHDLDGDARPNAGKTLLDAAEKLADAHHAHVTREDEIFRSAEGALTAEDDADIVAEMGTRRDRDGGAGGGGAGGGGGGGGGGRRRREEDAAAAAASAAKRLASSPKVAAKKPAAKKPSAKKPSAKKPAKKQAAIKKPAKKSGAKKR